MINLSGIGVETRIYLCFIEETYYLLGERLTLWSSRSELKGRKGVVEVWWLSRNKDGRGLFSVCLDIPRDLTGWFLDNLKLREKGGISLYYNDRDGYGYG